jgi:hypothetical protein
MVMGGRVVKLGIDYCRWAGLSAVRFAEILRFTAYCAGFAQSREMAEPITQFFAGHMTDKFKRHESAAVVFGGLVAAQAHFLVQRRLAQFQFGIVGVEPAVTSHGLAGRQ